LRRALQELRNNEIEHVEIAPSLIFPDYSAVTASQINEVKKYFSETNISISALQSIFYGRQELLVLQDEYFKESVEHLRNIIRLTADLGSNLIVFGSPKNRVKKSLSTREANMRLSKIFFEVSEDLNRFGVDISIEPNARKYGADYLNSYRQCLDFLDFCNFSKLKPQIDIGCQVAENDDVITAIEARIPHHVHLSNTNLNSIEKDSIVEEVCLKLSDLKYEGYLTVEMLGEGDEGLDAAIKSANWAKACNE
jgi:sugar phosphate isomerase/epimerase